ncbi:hypothetical protein TYRP_010992 [Tyrophagus putrescentiae]|nr:hypothetical protein TYRP_010992 [Tyrophagus putrescentiae]
MNLAPRQLLPGPHHVHQFTSTRLLIALALLIYLITPQSEAFWLGGGMGYRRFGWPYYGYGYMYPYYSYPYGMGLGGFGRR